jgi:hypothetical protein
MGNKKITYNPDENTVKDRHEGNFFNDVQQIIDMLEDNPDNKLMIEALKNTLKRGYNLVKLA